MEVQSPNIIAVIVMAILYMIIGAIWYSKSVLGNALLETCPTKKEECVCTTKTRISSFITALIMAYILSYFVNMGQAMTIAEGAKIGFLAWLGFVATVQFGAVLWCKMPVKAFCIHTGFKLVSLVILGAIFALWH